MINKPPQADPGHTHLATGPRRAILCRFMVAYKPVFIPFLPIIRMTAGKNSDAHNCHCHQSIYIEDHKP